MLRHRWLCARRSGQAMVEFAIIAPILLLVVLGIIQFGNAWNAYQTITETAREATRTAVIADPAITQDSIYRLINTRLWQAGLDSTKATKNILGWRTGTGFPTAVSIEYAYHMRWLQPMLQWTTGQAAVHLSAAPTFRQE